MKTLSRLLVLLLLLGAAGFAFLFWVPYGPASETFVDIPPGTSSTGIAARLVGAGIIRSRAGFLLMRKVHGGTLHAGEYRFDRPVPVGTVYRRIVKGDVYTKTLVIPEGFNVFDIANAVRSAGLGDASAFLAAANANSRLIADISPGATSLEGFLFPDTYRFPRHATPAQMCAAMVKRFRQVAASLGLLAPDATIGDPQSAALAQLTRTVTLASLIEKEVHNDSERPIVAGVFTNRLALGMPLATDPAVIYASLLAKRWRGTIYQSDLAFDSPYNTYRHAGLPPGPIANPGAAALKAAMHPAETHYLYFVADAQGNTRFSVDLKEHARQVAEYRQAQNSGPQPK